MMKPTIIRSTKVRQTFIRDKKVRDILDSKDWPYFKIALIKKTTNDIRTGYDKRANVVYYVLKGKSTCTLNGKKYKVKAGDFIVSPKGTLYKNLKGTILLAISSPRFKKEDRVYVE
jgi:mannose-6-phosphate isomerase-like protein (cupin superfamily)